MDYLRPALFGFILVTFTVCKPVSVYHTSSSSESSSSESSQSSSSEETRTQAENVLPVNDQTPPTILKETIYSAITGQTLVVDMKIHRSPDVSAQPDAETVRATDSNITTGKPASRGDNIK